MDLQEMKAFYPKTSNGANSDRKYFVSGSAFIKVDDFAERGQSEARILSSLSHPLVQKYIDSYISDDNKHILITEYFEGDTLENLLSQESLSHIQRITIESQLFLILSYLIQRRVHHGDINVSNILFNGERILLIDFEISRYDDGMKDLLGPLTETNHCGIFNVINIIRGRDKPKPEPPEEVAEEL